MYRAETSHIIYKYEIYTDGSKSVNGVGAGVVIFEYNDLKDTLKFKLSDNCSNNQAEQLAIIKALQHVKESNGNEGDTRTYERNIAVYTDSKITLDSLRNGRNHNNLIDEIRKNLRTVENNGWQVHFSWVKAHVGNYGRSSSQAGSNGRQSPGMLQQDCTKCDQEPTCDGK